MLQRELNTDNMHEVCAWASWYCKYGPHFQPSYVRFMIGIYQIHQGIRWKRVPSAYESYAAAGLHFLGAIEIAGYTMSHALPARVSDIVNDTMLDWKDLLHQISRAQQMIFYGQLSAVSRRKRFNSDVLVESNASIVTILISAIPTEKRTEAFYNATSIMLGVL